MSPSKCGSSPLARGRRPRQARTRPILGIIPARAGSTSAGAAEPGPGSDHPRSRGVDGCATTGRVCGTGSSPLARGRPLCAPWAASPGGSSPLARGRRLLHHRLHPQIRIIPARAGSTQPRTKTQGNLRIIPARAGSTPRPTTRPPSSTGSSPLARGRPRMAVDEVERRGSSPLARGRQVVADDGHVPRRIIPARAGSTGIERYDNQSKTDHPRSRGVDR